MDGAKQYISDLFDSLRARAGNPFVSAFVIAWLLWNYRIVLAIIGSGKPDGWKEKIAYIERLMPQWTDWVLHGYVIPSLFAFAWIFLLPAFFRFVSLHHEKTKLKSFEALYAVTETRVLSEADAIDLRATMVKQRAEWLAEKAETVKSLENLLKANDEKQAVIESLQARETSLEADLEQARKKLAAKDAEIQEIKSPKPEPLSFDRLVAMGIPERARSMFLQLNPHNPGVPLERHVVFEKVFLPVWPWTVPNEIRALMGLSGATGAGQLVLTEETVAGLLTLPDDFTANADEVAKLLSRAGVGGGRQTVGLMQALGVLTLKQGMLSPGQTFKRPRQALRVLGFSFVST